MFPVWSESLTEEKIRNKLQHVDTHEWKLAQTFDKLNERVRHARDKLAKRAARKEKRKRWFDRSPTRLLLKRILHSFATECVVFAVIFSNFVLTIHETDLEANSEKRPSWLSICSGSFLIFYVVELSLRFYAYGPGFFDQTSNIIDVAIVLIDLVCALVDLFAASATPAPGVLRIFRVMRVARAIRVMKHFHELYLMLYGLVSTLKAIFWAVVLIFMVLTCCSIMAVEFLHPINLEVAEDGVYEDCKRCPDAFITVYDANITFIQQILAGDSWGQIALPIIQKAPWTLFFFLVVLLTVHLGLMNLVLSVIVDKASQAHNENVEESLVSKMQTFRQAREQLTELCASMDISITGALTAADLLHGYDTNPEFAFYLNSMDVVRDDLPTLFKLLDRDESGDVTYTEFVEQLHRLKSHDSHTMMVFMQVHLQELAGVINNIANKMGVSGTHRAPSSSIIIGPSGLFEKSHSCSERTDDSNPSVGMSVKVEDEGKDSDEIDHHVGQLAAVTPSCTDLRKQSSAREVEDDHAERGVSPHADANRLSRHRSTTPAINSPQPGVVGRPGARCLTQPESKHVQDSIAKANDIIIRDLLAISYGRMLELTKHPDFPGLVQSLDTSQWTGGIWTGIPGDRVRSILL